MKIDKEDRQENNIKKNNNKDSGITQTLNGVVWNRQKNWKLV